MIYPAPNDVTVRVTIPAGSPSPEEIRETTALIRSGWSDYELAKRAGSFRRPWVVPSVRDSR